MPPDIATSDFRVNVQRTLIAAALAGLAVGVDYWVAPTLPTYSQPARAAWDAFLTSQLTLAAIWLVKGHGWLIVRPLPALTIIQVIGIGDPVVVSHTTAYLVVTVTLLLTHSAIVSGRRWRQRSTSAPARHQQFSIRQILEVTAAVAIVLAFCNWHRFQTGPGIDPRFLILYGILASGTLLAAWIAGGPTRRRILGLVLLPPASALMLYAGNYHDFPSSIRDIFAALLAEGLVAAGMLVYVACQHWLNRPRTE